MITNLKRLERNLGFKLKNDVFCLAIDTATKSGIAMIEIIKNKIQIETFILKLPALSKDIDSKAEKYEEHLELFYNLIQDELVSRIERREFKSGLKLLILENSFLKMNVVTFGFLRALQGIAYVKLRPYFNRPMIIFPTTVRKIVGFTSRLGKGTKSKDKKKEIMKWISNIVEEEIKDDNIADALLLCFAGLKQ